MIEGFPLQKTIAAMLLPPTSLFMLIALGLVLVPYRPRLGRLLAAAGLLVLIALSLPVVATALVSQVAEDPVLDLRDALQAEAIVVLGGGVRPNAVEYGGDTLGRLTLDRVRYGALVARKTKLPVLVTGGAVSDTTAEGILMRRTLEEEFGIPVRWVESRSRNTHQNAVLSSMILRDAGVKRIVLVAHSFDMLRAKAEFREAGLDVIPAPTGLLANQPTQPTEWIPTVLALQTSYWVLYESLANAWRRLAR